MSAPLVPPPANDSGALTCPRMLQRWLDINPVSHLTRTQAYITVPSFSVANTWNGYSTIVAAYNFEGPNNFSLKSLQTLSFGTPNYLLCVMWKDSSGNTNRYALWTGIGEVMPFELVLYTGQLIKKNFRLEVWSTNNTPLVQASPVNIYTSVLGGVDYRYGNDFTLINNDGQVTNFTDTTSYNPLPVPQTNIWCQFLASQGVAGVNWVGSIGGLNMQGGNTGNIVTTSDPLINNNVLITNANTLLNTYGTKGSAFIFGVWSVIKVNAATNGNCYYGLSTTTTTLGGSFLRVLQAGTNIQVDGNTIASNITTGIWYVMFWVVDFTNNVSGGYMIPLTGSAVEPVFTTAASANAAMPTVLTVGANALFVQTIDFEVAEILVYNGSLLSPFRQSVLNYLFSKYGAFTFPLPLTFPTNSSPQPNT